MRTNENYYKTQQKYAIVVSRIAFVLLPIELVKMRSLLILSALLLNSGSQAAPQPGISLKFKTYLVSCSH